MKLISMTDFVLSVVNADRPCNRGKMLDEIGLYAEFLKQPLKLEMFVPCVDNEPFNYSKHGNAEQYEQAKEIVLFEYKFYFNYIKQSQLDNKTIEDLLKDDIEYFLTQNATKQFL